MRPIRTHVYHVKRCTRAGSCTTDQCETSPNKTVQELRHTAKYPGSSGYLSSCGGMLRGCFMPLPTSWFYKVAHKPTITRVFEVIRCPYWSPTVQLDVGITIAHNTESISHSLKPYVTENLSNLNITVASIQKPIGSLTNKRFAISIDRCYLLLDNYQLQLPATTTLRPWRNSRRAKIASRAAA